ncbi:MAG: ORF6N domain-containing protein, partial [Patescibacteria group bacterium]
MAIRGEKVILDSDLADLYGVETRRLNEQVRRNIEKFPEDFMFQLTKEEFENLKSQIATSSSGWGGRRKLPLVFTEHGALQAANVLSTEQANKMSVFIV